jgi:hypothetical protein
MAKDNVMAKLTVYARMAAWAVEQNKKMEEGDDKQILCHSHRGRWGLK